MPNDDSLNLNSPHEIQSLQQKIQLLQEELRQSRDQFVENRSSLEFYQNLVDLAVDAIITGNSEGDIVSANQSASDLTGYSIAELSGKNIAVLFSAEEHQRVQLRYDLLKAGKVVKTERMLTRKDGSTIPIEMNSKLTPNGDYHAFVRDVSQRKEVEEALRQSEEKFSRAFKLNPDAINLNRVSDGSYIEVNQGFTDLLGWTAEEVIGRSSNPADLGIWCHTEDRERLIAGLRKDGEVTGFQASFHHKDGRVVIGLMSARVIEINQEPCILSITRDITENVRMQEQHQKLEVQMLKAQKLESLGVLAGGIAHDFNNLLAVIIGNTEMARRRLKPESFALVNLERIGQTAERAADLVRQMLAYSGQGQFEIESFDLNSLIEEMLHMLEVSIAKKTVLRLNLDPSLPRIEGDTTQICQIIMNLVINASESIDDPRGVISISTGGMDCDDHYLKNIWFTEGLNAGLYAYLEITDTGCGMDNETRAKLFDPFFTTKFTGRGLGMSAVLGIVRGHKGAIQVYSEPGKGTTFKILLPADSSLSEETIIPSENDWQGSGKILLVDDEESVRKISAEMIEELGFEVITACDGRDALEKFDEHQDISCVILDLTMPHMDGEQCFRELRRRKPQIKVVMCSGYNAQEVTQKFIGKGLAGFIQKPYKLTDLKAVLS